MGGEEPFEHYSLVSEGDHGIDAHSATGGDVAGWRAQPRSAESAGLIAGRPLRRVGASNSGQSRLRR